MLRDLRCHLRPAPLAHQHICSCAHAPDIRTGSSSLTVFMELTSICLCSWCVSSCCLSSIIFDILVIPGKEKSLCCRDTWRGTERHTSKRLNFNRGSLRARANSFPPSGAPHTNGRAHAAISARNPWHQIASGSLNHGGLRA